jgi:DNA-binding transcriptional LysR family regulator
MWRDVELRELRIFLALADELHFGRTAERLGISQPGVSEAVRVLESRLGVKVFDRTSRRVRLTPAGEELKRNVMPALAALDHALAETSQLSRAVRGLLRVGFVLTTEGPALSRLVAAFQARYPACEVRLQEVETFDAYRGLRRGDIDVLCNWLAPTNQISPQAPRSPTTRGRSPSRLRTASQGSTRSPSRIWPARKSPCSPRPPRRRSTT